MFTPLPSLSRPPQPSAAHSPSSQPLPQVGLANKDKSNIIIKKGSSLTGRHIAAITNNTTLQPTSGGSMQPAYAQGTIPQTVDSIKSEYDPADTGWPHPPPEPVTMATENQTFGNQGTDKTVGGVSVPMVTAPGVMDLSTVAHSPGGGNLLGSPVRPSGLLHPQGVGTSPRPQILRKRALDRCVLCVLSDLVDMLILLYNVQSVGGSYLHVPSCIFTAACLKGNSLWFP